MIMPDNRGVGQSVALRPRTMRHFSCDLVELLDHLQLESAHVIGISLGGIIAQQLAIDHPSRVRRLVLISCGNQFGPYLREMARFMVESLRRFSAGRFARSMEMLTTGPEFVDAHFDQFEQNVLTKLKRRVSRSGVLTELRCLRASGIESSYDIRCPTLVIAGEYDALIPNCYARRMAAGYPGQPVHGDSGRGAQPALRVPGPGHARNHCVSAGRREA